MRTFHVELSMLNKMLGYRCIQRTLAPALLVRSDGFFSTMLTLKHEGWSDWVGFEYAKLDEGNDADGGFLLSYTLKSSTREVEWLEVQVLANVNEPWPSLSEVFGTADGMEANVAAITGFKFVMENVGAGQ